MKNNKPFVGITLFIIAIAPLIQAGVNEEIHLPISKGKILYVGGIGPENYSTIQAALDVATDGDTIFVFNDSSPYEECIEIHDKISLIGEDKESTIIIGDCLEKIITVYDRQVTISGFTIKTNDSKRYPFYGIYIKGEETTIKDNIS